MNNNDNKDQTIKWYMHKLESILENETYKTLWDFEIQTVHRIPPKRPALVIINNNKKKEKKTQLNSRLCCPGGLEWKKKKKKKEKKRKKGRQILGPCLGTKKSCGTWK